MVWGIVYAHKNIYKYCIKSHLVSSVKYGRKIFDGKFNNGIEDSARPIANNSNFGIDIMKVNKAYMHLLVTYHPNCWLCQSQES